MEPIRAAEINERRQAAATREMADEAIDIGPGVATASPGVAWINHATMVGFGVDVPDSDLDRLEAFYRDRGLPPKLECTTFATAGFLQQLAARGYAVEHFEHVFTRPLAPGDDPGAGASHAPPPGLEIIPTDPTDDAACRVHAVLMCRGSIPEPIPEPQIEMCVRSLRNPRALGFIATLGGEPIAGGGMEVFEHDARRVCSLWGVTVAEPHRRRGVQQALIARRLAAGIERGCVAAFIESKPGIATERNAARLGFSLAYARVAMVQAHTERNSR